MEMLAVSLFSNFYHGKRVLVTGHTGFKGSWLALWLTHLGAEVIGISLENTGRESHWESLALNCEDLRFDIRDFANVNNAVARTKPDLIFHLAAQPLVRESYKDPLNTWSTNVMGTANILQAALQFGRTQGIVIVTTDKTYKNKEWSWGYREIDELGGHDPYSASKASSEIVAESYRRSFSENTNFRIATARAGNVIGGGDWSHDRLVPDVIRSLQNCVDLEIRSPASIRPWQHVLDSLGGYLLLCQRLVSGPDNKVADAWNFGPEVSDTLSVEQLLRALKVEFPNLKWSVPAGVHPHETATLKLDISKAKADLGWKPVWNIQSAVAKTAAWYKEWMNLRECVSSRQIEEFAIDALELGADWVKC